MNSVLLERNVSVSHLESLKQKTTESDRQTDRRISRRRKKDTTQTAAAAAAAQVSLRIRPYRQSQKETRIEDTT